jgi:hypothetical protein
MFEYANGGILLLGLTATFTVFLLLILMVRKAQSENRPIPKSSVFLAVIFLFLAGMNFYEGFASKRDALAGFAKFEKGGELRCSTMNGVYLVSKGRFWSRVKDEFIKDDLLVNIRWCSVEE